MSKSKKVPTKLPELKERNSSFLSAKSRKSAGPMNDKREGRGGSSNKQSKYLQDNWEQSPDILSGSVVFKGTRLSVFVIGKRAIGGDSIQNILEDYNYLTKDDVLSAIKYVEENTSDEEEHEFDNL